MASYVTLDELAMLGLPDAALADVSRDEKLLACEVASSEADGNLAARHSVPLANPPLALKKHVAMVASYDLMMRRGFSPQGDDSLLRQIRTNAERYYKALSAGTEVLSPAEVDPAPIAAVDVSSDCPRGW